MDNADKTLLGLLAVLLAILGFLVSSLVGQRNDTVKAEAVRQVQIDTFYRDHNCKPLGYVATKYEPVRTYQCDNGVFIPRDMGR